MRGLISKKASLDEIIKKLNPTIVGLVETHLSEEKTCEFVGYVTYRNDRDQNGGGTLLAIKQELEPVTIVTKSTQGQIETLWIKINNGKNKLNIACVYAPKEANSTPLYTEIKLMAQEVEQQQEDIIVMGDFNCKVGTEIHNNSELVTAGGKKILNLLSKQELMMVNSHPKTKGLWTRIQGSQKAVIDYVLITKRNEERLKQVVIDDKKEYTPFNTKDGTYTDHCSIFMSMDWKMKLEEQKPRKISSQP